VSVVQSPKNDVLKIVERLPDDASYEDIQYHIYVRQKVLRGLKALKRGDTMTQREVDQRLAKWLGE
jgi:hypothetical protein